MRRAVSTLVLSIGIAGVAGCGGNPPPEPPPPQREAARPQPPTRPSAPSDDAARRAREAEAAAERARREREAEMARMRETLSEMVFFDFDRSEIRADSRSALDRKVRILREQPSVRIRVEGHADERGSTEYNLALGSRRAESVRAYMTGMGVNVGRIDITTYGEARPLASGSNESSWARNRRAEFVITAGGLTADR